MIVQQNGRFHANIFQLYFIIGYTDLDWNSKLFCPSNSLIYWLLHLCLTLFSLLFLVSLCLAWALDLLASPVHPSVPHIRRPLTSDQLLTILSFKILKSPIFFQQNWSVRCDSSSLCGDFSELPHSWRIPFIFRAETGTHSIMRKFSNINLNVSLLPPWI